VGSWPEPFAHGFQGRRWPTSMDCRAAAPVCTEVSQRLAAAGIRPTGSATGAIELDVGTWEEIRAERDVGLLSSGPDRSGVFARFVGTHKPLLEVLDRQGQPAGSIGKGGGLIAALRTGDGPPTWVITGTDAKGVAAAANLFGDALRNHYAVATQPGAGPIGVPVQ